MLANLRTRLSQMWRIQPCQTLSFPSSDLFQDLSQLQETWLTEGETSASGPLFFFFFFVLLLVASVEDFIMTVMGFDDVSVWLKKSSQTFVFTRNPIGCIFSAWFRV